MAEIPNPAQLAQQRQAAEERTQERNRVSTVRKRRRLVRGASLTAHIEDETARALAKLAHPDTGGTRD